MLELAKETLGELVWGVLAIVVFVWWIGGPGVTAIVWSGGDKRLAVQFLAAWASVTTLYLTTSWLIRRARRA
ncbi:hypothetical protein ABT121_37885 [Streptomyces sp. NPDC001928]|uniref:hypothetical protein n=1 Tax=Streptomyces sp. NPDC001928 TaxID=3154404 RepID=UPI003320831B